MRWIFCLWLISTNCFLYAANLFEHGKWQVAIVQPDYPEPDEWYAAQTLAQWCEAVTGQRPQIFPESRAPQAAAIYIGQTVEFKKLNGIASPGEGDQAVCFLSGNKIFLGGNQPVGTRIAVGRFCERELGVCFTFPGVQGADWTPLSQVGWPRADVFKPKFPWREIAGLSNEISQEWAYSIGYGRAPQFSHAMHIAFGKQVEKEDPTCAPLIYGVRQPLTGSAYGANPNLLAPRAPEWGARYARDWYHNHPQDFSVPFGVNDTLQFDDRAPSSGWYRDRPVRTDYLIRYLNQVAASFWQPGGDLKGEYHAIGTLAYLQTLQAPQVRVHPAIFPWVCADRMGYGDEAFAQMEAKNLKAWVNSGAKRVGAYDYWYGVEYMVPRVNFKAQSQAIQQAAQAGVVGWYAEVSPLWAFDAPKLWLGAKLLENPEQSPERLLTDWFKAAYGVGAPQLTEIYKICGAAWERDAQKGGTSQWLRHYKAERSITVFTEAEFAAITQNLKQAVALFESQPTRSARVNRQYQRLQQWCDAWNLVQKMQATFKARTATPLTAVKAEAALHQLVLAEVDLAATEQRFNVKWGAYGRPVKWAEQIGRDPRPEWYAKALAGGVDEARLARWAAEDTVGIGVWLAAMAKQPGVLRDINFNIVELSPARTNRVYSQDDPLAMHYVAPAGILMTDVPLKVTPGSYQALQVKLQPTSDPEAQVFVEVYGKGSRPNFYHAIRCGVKGGTLVVHVPPGITELNYKIRFEKAVILEATTLTEWEGSR